MHVVGSYMVSMRREQVKERMDEALQHAHLMLHQGTPIPRDTFHTLLQHCIKKKNLEACRHAHSLLLFCGFAPLAALVDHCIRMFALSGSLFEASLAFSSVSEPHAYTWHAIISAHFKLGSFKEAFDLYHNMQHEGIQPSYVVFLTMLKECGSHCAIGKGRILHNHVMSCGFEPDLAVGSALVDMYAKCGSLTESRNIFDRLLVRDLVIWNAMIAGYAQHGHGLPALELFNKMQTEGVKPHVVTFASVLRACSSIRDIEKGREIHFQINRSGLECDVVVGSALTDMYAKCCSLGEAREVFDKLPNKNVVSWNAIIAGYAQQGLGSCALDLFMQMQCSGVKPDKVTFLSLLKSCDGLHAFNQGLLIHDQIVENGFDSDVVVGTTLVDMYARFGSLDDAHKVFNQLPNRNVVSWGAIVAGYAQQGHGLPALELYSKMQQDCIQPDKVMLLCVLRACASAGAMAQGKLIHDQIIRGDLESDVIFGSALVDMYAKCGNLEEAYNVFFRLPQRDLVSWSVMISAYSQFGNSTLAQQCLEEMQRQGLKPDHGIYTSMLAACSRACEIKEGLACFQAMKEHGITPRVEHYNSIIVLLSHAGCFNEAGQLVQTMPLLPDTTEWTALLAACRAHGNMELGSRCFDQVVQSDSSVAAGYVLMSNMYADSHMWENVDKLQGLRACAGAWKKPGGAWIEVNMQMHDFIVDDESRADSVYISAKLNSLKSLMKMHGYVPQGDFKVGPMTIEGKQDVLHQQPDGLGVVFGVLDTPQGTSIRVATISNVHSDSYNCGRRNIVINGAYHIYFFDHAACPYDRKQLTLFESIRNA